MNRLDGDFQGSLEIIAEVIARHYDTGVVSRIVPLEGAHQFRHRKLVVETPAGKFLAKTYRNDVAVLDALNFLNHLMRHLRQHELPVADIMPALSGKGYVVLDTWVLELQHFVEAEGMKVNSPTLKVAADTLGRFHTACHDFPAPPRDVNLWRFSEVPRTLFQDFYQRAREAAGNNPAIDDHCNDAVRFIAEAAQALSPEMRAVFEIGLIHGDWHGGNLLFQDDALQAIVDFEFTGRGCYLEDIAYGISNLCIRSTPTEDRMDFRTNLFLDEYQRHRSLSYAEKYALYYAVGIKHITTVAYQLQQQPLVAGYDSVQWMERLAAQCRWLSAQSHKVKWGKK